MLKKTLLAPDDRCFASVGYACGVMQITPAQLGTLMEAAGVRFAEMRDGVLYLDDAGFRAVTAKLAEVSAEISDAVHKAERAPLN